MGSYFDSSELGSFDQYLQDVEKYPLIEDREEEQRIARRAREGDRQAAERLVTANLRFVISYVKKYQGRGLSLAELVCIGNKGLLKAVKKFDPDKGVKFISYAVWWIRQTVLQALAEETRSVRIPLNQNSNLVKLSRTKTRLTQELGRSPTDRELAEEMDESVETIRTGEVSYTYGELEAATDLLELVVGGASLSVEHVTSCSPPSMKSKGLMLEGPFLPISRARTSPSLPHVERVWNSVPSVILTVIMW